MAFSNELADGLNRPLAHWTYATAAARTGDTGFFNQDIGKIAYQTDTNTYWVLTATTPAWAVVGATIVSSPGQTYTLVLADANTVLQHTSTATTYTIPANSSVAFPVGTIITIINATGAGTLTLAITSDTLQRGDGTAGTGSRTIAADSVVTITKVASTTWYITGKFT